MPAHPESLRRQPTFLLARAATMARRACGEALAEVGLSQAEHGILACLHECGPLMQRDVAERLALDPGDLVTYLDKLEALQAISRTPDKKDRRRRVIAPTALGDELLARADDALATATTRLLGPLGPAEITQLTATLTRLLGAHDPAHWSSAADPEEVKSFSLGTGASRAEEGPE
ncbi:MarR family winged helix-turn-helix transcriptional regulator [Microbispora sp. NPDC046973]|uniref:MarR family winged helix-turn-helix transcriptional regulator n=1 Tax=Microbispora sp. NPDC046973 TaxID=3155022 RepID=UPI0033D829FA